MLAGKKSLARAYHHFPKKKIVIKLQLIWQWQIKEEGFAGRKRYIIWLKTSFLPSFPPPRGTLLLGSGFAAAELFPQVKLVSNLEMLLAVLRIWQHCSYIILKGKYILTFLNIFSPLTIQLFHV